MRWFGLDVHRDFCEVAVVDEEGVRSAGRIATRMPTLELFAESLAQGDVVALEATTGADRIVSVLERQGIRVVVANATAAPQRATRDTGDLNCRTDRACFLASRLGLRTAAVGWAVRGWWAAKSGIVPAPFPDLSRDMSRVLPLEERHRSGCREAASQRERPARACRRRVSLSWFQQRATSQPSR